MAFSRTTYDSCAYDLQIKQSTDQGDYRLYGDFAENKNQCYSYNGPIGSKSDVSLIKKLDETCFGTMTDVESDLSWRNNKQVQTSGKHCGVFQIHFITTILELYKQKKLFNVSGNILQTKSINNELLSHYLQDDLSQSVIEKTISNYFYVNI